MLVLTRKVGEVVFIGEEILIEVLDMTRGRVSLGITAPGDVEVVRSEISCTGHPTHLTSKSAST